jgi:hexokinase
MNQELDTYLKQNGLDLSHYDFDAEVKRFQETMDACLKVEGGAIPMLPTYVGVPETIEPNTEVLVIDLGGTNLRTGLIRFDENSKASIGAIRKQKVPGVYGPATRDDVYDAIAELSHDWVGHVDFVGFCFSFPFCIEKDGSARVLHFGKELQVHDMVDSFIVDDLRAAWARKGVEKAVKVTVLNDTVSTLLMGKLNFPRRPVSGYLGFILGTGMNISYIESNEKIAKNPELKAGMSQIINTECGDYPYFARSRFDELFDAQTKNTGHYFTEKMMSGAFIGKLAGVVINEAFQAGVLKATIEKPINTKDLNDFVLGIYDPENPLVSLVDKHPEIRTDLFELIDPLLERAALLVAIILVAVITRDITEATFDKPVLLSIDGSSYGGENFYRERIEHYLYDELTIKRGIRFQILRPENASLLGASVAALGSQI